MWDRIDRDTHTNSPDVEVPQPSRLWDLKIKVFFHFEK
jgi:hypothetical protein